LRVVLVAALATAPAVGGMRVVGLGPGRTGTDSLRRALEILGFGPCYHMSEVFFELPSGLPSRISTAGHLELWRDTALRAGGGAGPPRNEGGVDLVEMLQGWDSGVDFPLAAFPEEMLEAFPEAKFVLTVRDGGGWYKSIRNTICHQELLGWYSIVLRLFPFKPYDRVAIYHLTMDAIVRHRFSPSHLTWHSFCQDEAGAVAAYDAWNARVKSLIPKEQLLVFEVGKHGFPELARFLGTPEPTFPSYGKGNGPQVKMPYPRSNSTRQFKIIFWVIEGVPMLAIGLLLLLFLRLAQVLMGLSKASWVVKQKED